MNSVLLLHQEMDRILNMTPPDLLSLAPHKMHLPNGEKFNTWSNPAGCPRGGKGKGKGNKGGRRR